MRFTHRRIRIAARLTMVATLLGFFSIDAFAAGAWISLSPRPYRYGDSITVDVGAWADPPSGGDCIEPDYYYYYVWADGDDGFQGVDDSGDNTWGNWEWSDDWADTYSGNSWNYSADVWVDDGCGGQEAPTEYDDESPAPPGIGGVRDVWWFNGETPSNYSTASILFSDDGDGTYWEIVSGSDKVQIVGNGATATVTTTGSSFSGSPGDITIRASFGTASSDYQMTAHTPDSLFPGTATTSCDGTYGYITVLAYKVKDNLLSDMPYDVEANENFPDPSLYYDFSGANWGQSPPNGFMTSGADMTDSISPPPLARTPAPYPTPTCDGNSTAVVHWPQEWRIGSQTVGLGSLVQTDTLQKLIGRALHTSIVSPVR